MNEKNVYYEEGKCSIATRKIILVRTKAELLECMKAHPDYRLERIYDPKNNSNTWCLNGSISVRSAAAGALVRAKILACEASFAGYRKFRLKDAQ